MAKRTWPAYWTTDSGMVVRVSTCKRWMPHKNLLQRQARAFIHYRDSFTCQRCGFAPGHPISYSGKAAVLGLETDHVVPLSNGGGHHPDNLQVLCMTCNCQKGPHEA